MNNHEHVLRYARTRSRTRMLDVDLNAAPPCENRGTEGNSDHTRSQERQAAQEVNVVPTTIDVEALDDDDVVISSPRAFAEAKNNARRNRGRTVVVDLDSNDSPEDRLCRNKRRKVPANQTVINCDLYANGGGSGNAKNNNDPPVAKEVTFSCPICMDTLVEAVSTKCGHIFCNPCIKAAIAAQSRCPTCRKKTTTRDIIRIYLPAPKSV